MLIYVIKKLFFLLVVFDITIGVNDANDERNIKGKVVIVTGAAQGIGFAIADNFAKNGAKVVILLDIQKEKGKEAEKKLNSKYGNDKTEFIKCDIRKDLERVSKLILKKYKYVNVLVNNAGIGHENDPKGVIDINVMGTILSSLRFLEDMRKDKGGKGGTIINVSSITARNVDPAYPIYRASKLAVLGFSLSQGHIYNCDITGVRIITLCPGPTDTALANEGYCLYDKKLTEMILKSFNYTILQTPDDVGKGAVTIFKIAESGTSWDVTDKKAPIKSNLTINVVSFENDGDNDDTKAKREKIKQTQKNQEKKNQTSERTTPKKEQKEKSSDGALIVLKIL